MSWHGEWHGFWHGDWFGPLEQVAGAISGAASITVSASGSLSNGANVVPITGGRRRQRLPYFEPAIIPPRPWQDEDEEVALLIAIR